MMRGAVPAVATLAWLVSGCPDPRFVVSDDADADAAVAPDADAAIDVAADARADAGLDVGGGGCTIEPSWLDRTQIIYAPAAAAGGGWFSRDLLFHDGELLIGSPSEEAVYRYARVADEQWSEVQRFTAPRDLEAFGISLSANGDQLAIGSLDPVGGVWIYERAEPGGPYASVQEVSPPGEASGLFGGVQRLGPGVLLASDSDGVWAFRDEGDGQVEVAPVAQRVGYAWSGRDAVLGDPDNIDPEFITVGGIVVLNLDDQPFYSLLDVQYVDGMDSVRQPLGGTVVAADDIAAVSSEGAEYVAIFERVGGFWQQAQLLRLHTLNAGAGAEMAMDVGGGWIVDGAPDALGLLAEHAGSVGVYRRSDAGWGVARIVKPAIEDDNGFFGSDVAIEYPWVAIGSLGPADGSTDDRGMVSVYRFSAACGGGFHGPACAFRCDDGVRNGGELEADEGGPCVCAP